MKKLLSLVMVALMILSAFACQAESAAYTAGTYTGAGKGMNGDVIVEVTFTADSIESVAVVSHGETPGISDPAIAQLPAAIVANQSLGIDAVVSATMTSKGILAAVEDCVAQAGGDVEALKNVEITAGSVEKQTEKLECDVLVVGSGLTGMIAATAASDEGASVIVLEKLPVTGGSARSSEGVFMVVEVEENKEYHNFEFEDTLEDATARWKEKMSYSVRESTYPDYDRLSTMFVETMRTVDWMKQQGAVFAQDPQWTRDYVYMDTLSVDVPQNQTEGAKNAAKLIDLLQENMTANGAQILLQTPATELIMDNDVVVGAKASGIDTDYEIYAGSVILACGGFGADPEQMDLYLPEFTRVGYYDMGVAGNTGDGMKMAVSAGADVYKDNWVVPTFIAPSDELVAHNSMFRKFMDTNGLPDPEISADRLVVDGEGNRFMDESSHYAVQNITLAYHNVPPYYTLYAGLSQELNDILDTGIETGDVIKADTIEELAIAAGMDPQVLTATVSRYDELAKAGEDTDFGKSASKMFAIPEEGPYYFVRFEVAEVGTIGGVKTNDNFQVLREDGSVIEGLYAAGEMANGFLYNQNYISGSSLIFSATMGLIAGQHAAAAK